MNMKDEEPKIINNFIKLISTNNAPLVDATFLSLNLSNNAKISSFVFIPALLLLL